MEKKKKSNKREVGEVTVSMSSYLLNFEVINMAVILNGILGIIKVRHQKGENPNYTCNR